MTKTGKNAKNTQIGKPFEKGNAGRPKGSKNKVTLAVENLLEGEADKLTRKAIELALNGDTTALKLCLERICPARKERYINFDFPRIENIKDLPKATRALTKAVANGELTPTEATEFSKLINIHLQAIEVAEFEERLIRLEQGVDNENQKH